MKQITKALILLAVPTVFSCQNKPQKEETMEKGIVIESPMTATEWALGQRKLFKLYDSAVRMFDDKYIGDNGFLKVIERWGGNDGADDAMENFSHWPLVYALGGPEVLLDLYEKAWEGHLVQFTNAKIPEIEMAKDGMYYKEFITSFDWEHNGEGLSAFNFYSLINPDDPKYEERVKRFAGFYMNEDPEAPNYDPEKKIIKSLHNGSRGPKLTHATEMDWGGLPVEGRPERLTRYSTAGNILGDHPLNLISTSLAMNAYMITGEEKYKNWVLEYTGAWRDRVIENGGNIPSNIGLDGTIGGEWDGKWYGGTFGWNFWPQSNSRNYTLRGARIAFGNAFLLSKDMSFVDTLYSQMQNLYAAKKMEGDKTLLPNKHGDDGWYGYRTNRRYDVLKDTYLWSMDAEKLEYVSDNDWISYLLGDNPDYPQKTIQEELEYISECIEAIGSDGSSQDERQADDIQGISPLRAGPLVQLTTGGNDPGNSGNILHCRVRYFDPEKNRVGLPEDVAALVEKITAKGITLTLVNTNSEESRNIILQAGAYGEHQFETLKIGDEEIEVKSKHAELVLKPGAGSLLEIKMQLYANQPTLKHPW
ncbi:MAG: hypothetical protein JXQ96_21625 [Cyclobacteriaceae bacterium]